MRFRIPITIVAATLLICIGFWVCRTFSAEQVARHELELRQTIQAWPLISVFVGFVASYLASLIPGTSGKSILMGWLFGVYLGVGLCITALTTAALTSFSLSRFVLREAIESRWHMPVKLMNERVTRDGAFYLLTLRMLHVPYTLVNYLSGASRIPMSTFAWTTAVGMLPGTVVFVLLGSSLPTLDEFLAGGARSLLDPWLLLALIASGFLPITMRWVFRYLRHCRQPSTPATES